MKPSQEVKQRILDADKRTIILRRVDPDATVESIIKDIVDQAPLICQGPDLLAPGDLLEQVTRDELDRRRYYVTYLTRVQKQKFQETGFRVGKTYIPPTLGDFQGFIQFPPYFLGKQDLQEIMTSYGTILNDRFVEVQGVRTGGWHFELRLHDGKTIPNVIDFDGEPIPIINKSARKLCTWCHNWGHLQRQCQKRRAHRLKQLEAHAYSDPVELMETNKITMSVSNQHTTNSIPSAEQQPLQQKQAPLLQQGSLPGTTGSKPMTTGDLSQETLLNNSQPAQQEPTPLPNNNDVQSTLVLSAGEKHPRHCSTSSGEAEPPFKVCPQQSPSGTSFPQPTQSQLPASSDTVSKINALFQEFSEVDKMADLDSEEIPTELYEHYVARRRELALRSRTDVAGEQYPSQEPNKLSRVEWEAISEAVNARFCELLISEFPENHFQLNELYISRKRNQGKSTWTFKMCL